MVRLTGAVVLLWVLLAGAAPGVLTYLGAKGPASAALAGGAAFAGAVLWVDKILGA